MIVAKHPALINQYSSGRAQYSVRVAGSISVSEYSGGTGRDAENMKLAGHKKKKNYIVCQVRIQVCKNRFIYTVVNWSVATQGILGSQEFQQ